MGSSIDRYLQKAGTTSASAEQPTGLDDYLTATPARDTTKRLSLAVEHGEPKKADLAARVLRLQRQSNLPADVIERNIDALEQRRPPDSWQLARLQRESPALASWLAEHPNHASVASDDLPNLSLIENIIIGLAGPKNLSAALTAIRGRQSGKAQAELGRWGYEAQQRGGVGQLSEPARARIQQLQEEVAREPGGLGFLERVLYRGSQVFGQMVESGPRALIGAGAGALGGGLAGAALGPAGAIAGAKAGAEVGLAAGFGWDTFQIEGGSAYLELSRMLDERGQAIDEDTKAAIASGVGSVNALLEIGGVAAIVAPYRAAVRKLMRESVRDALERPTMRAALNDLGRSYMGAIAGETGTEVAQEISSIVGEEIARAGGAGELDELLTDPAKREAMVVRIGQIAQQTAEGMLLVGAPGAAIHGASSAYQATKATQREQFYLALGERIAESKTFERLPEAVQAVVERATKDGPIETVYAPVETWMSYWQSAKQDPVAVARELGVEKQLEEAQATGGDIAIPIGTYATKIAPTEHNAYFAKELRARPNEMNAREAAEWRDRSQQQADELAETPEGREQQAIEDDVAGQLVNAGYEESIARNSAKQLGAFFRVMAGRAKKTPMELFQRYNFSVTREQTPAQAPIGTKVSLEDVANRALSMRERQAEAAGREADEAGEAASPYALDRSQRDAVARNDAKEFLYARTEKGALRGNLTTIATDGLIEELAYLFERQQEDAQASAPTLGKTEGSGVGFTNVVTVRRAGAINALGRMSQRAKSIARIEAELQRRNVEDADAKLFKFISGEDPTAFDPSTFQQSAIAEFTETAAFKRWFGESKVVGVDGEPRVLYHQTSKIAEEAILREGFDLSKGRARLSDEGVPDGIFLKPTPDNIGLGAADVADQAQIPLFARIERPLRVANREALAEWLGRDDDYLRLAFDVKRFDAEQARIYDAWDKEQHKTRRMENEARFEAYMSEAQSRIDAWRSGNEERATLARARATVLLKEAGFDGVILEKDQGGLFGRLVVETYVVFDPRQVKSAVDNQGTFDPASPNILHQSMPGGERPRGKINFKVGDQAAVNIQLLADADLSTFLHETGHFYLEVMKDLATAEDAAPEIAKDFETIKKWVKWEDGQTAFTREQHEQWATGFEAFLMEGKAPSTELRGAFARFRAWLVGLYRSFEALQVFLSDDVRAVMSRMLAAEDEIAAAQREQKMDPLFADPAAVGMTPAQAESYAAAVTEARETAENELAARLIADVKREQDAIYKAERRKVREEIVEEVNQERDSAAFSFLSRGTLPDGSPLPAELEAAKLSKAALAAEYADRYPNLMARLRSRFLYSKEGGVHPDQVAEWFGYASGDELIQALLAYAGTPRQRIERLTDERMRADDPNLVTPAELPVEAMKAVHNEKRAQVLHMELAHLASSNLPVLKGLIRRVARPIPPLEEVRHQAERIVAHRRIRDLNPLLYQRAEEKAARMAVEALLKGDVAAAFDEKQRELLNHELYRAASAARERSERIATDLSRFSLSATRERLGKAGGDYLAQIDGLLARFDFRKGITLAGLDKRRSLREWYDAQVDPPVIPEKLLDEAYRTHFKELTPGELEDVYHAVLAIEHLANFKNRLLASQRARELDEARTEIVASIGAHHDLRVRPEGHPPKGIRENLVKLGKHYFAEHTRMEFLFDFLDGLKGHGVVWQYFFKPFADAETSENDLRANDANVMRDIMAAYTDQERAEWFTKKVFIPVARSKKHDGTFTKSAILAMALNWGNAYNRDALMQGYDWTLGQVEAVLEQLDARDWLTVQRIWDHLNTYWPAVEALEKDLSGIAPKKVEATPFSMKGVNLKGGYYPILFDRERSVRQTKLDTKSSVQEMFGGNWARAMTRHGHTIERTNTGGKPLKLELAGLADHLGQVTHDLTHRRAVIDVRRLIDDPEIAKAIELAVGREMYLQLDPWLHAIAGDRARAYSGTMERVLGHARAGATVVGLGLKVTSALLQSLGYALATNELGPKYAAAGLRDWMKKVERGNPFGLVKDNGFIGSRSPMMRDRIMNYDRDVRDFARRQDVIEGAQATWFVLIGYMDLATSIPTWLGAYRKGMDGKVTGIAPGDERSAVDYADKVVRETQAAGAAKDLASVQRGGEAWRLFTMFYSSMSIIFNQFARAGQRYVLEKNVPQLMGTLALIWVVPVLLEAAIRGDTPDDDEGWAKHLAKRLAAYPFGSVVLARDVVSSLDRYDYSGSPAAEFGDNLSRSLKVIGKAVDPDDDITRADWKALVNTVGYSAKLPTAQMWKTGEYLHDWATGIEQPESVITGIYRAAISGKPRR